MLHAFAISRFKIHSFHSSPAHIYAQKTEKQIKHRFRGRPISVVVPISIIAISHGVVHCFASSPHFQTQWIYKYIHRWGVVALTVMVCVPSVGVPRTIRTECVKHLLFKQNDRMVSRLKLWNRKSYMNGADVRYSTFHWTFPKVLRQLDYIDFVRVWRTIPHLLNLGKQHLYPQINIYIYSSRNTPLPPPRKKKSRLTGLPSKRDFLFLFSQIQIKILCTGDDRHRSEFTRTPYTKTSLPLSIATPALLLKLFLLHFIAQCATTAASRHLEKRVSDARVRSSPNNGRFPSQYSISF